MKNYINSQGFVSVGDTTNTLYIQENVQVTGSFSITGSISMNGTTVKAIKGPSITVGNALRGDTINDCDYLDAGDGVQLQAALTAAGARTCDVFVREGIYTIATQLSVPSLVTVHFSGYGTILKPTSTNRSLITFAYAAKAYDLYIEVGVAGPGATGAVLITIGSEVILVNPYIYTTFVSTAPNMTNESLRTMISGSAVAGSTLINPFLIVPSFESAGVLTSSVTGIAGNVGSTIGVFRISNPHILNGDVGIALSGPSVVNDFNISAVHRRGITIAASTGGQRSAVVNSGLIATQAFNEESVGLEVLPGLQASGPFGAKISNVSFTKFGANVTSSTGIRLTGIGSGTQIEGCSFESFPIGVTASATHTNVICVGNTIRNHTAPQHFLIQSSGSIVANNIVI